MKPIHFKKIHIVLLMLIVTAASCKKETKYDITGDKINRVYIVGNSNMVNSANSFRFSIINTAVGAVGAVNAAIPARTTMPAPSALKVAFTVDNGLVATYNSANNTNYEPMPGGILDLTTASITIPQGQQVSGDSLKIAIPTDKLSALAENTYLLPVKISGISGDANSQVSNNQNVVYLIVKVTVSTSQFYESPGAADMTGSIIADRSKWSATIDQPLFGGDMSNLFDGDNQSYFFTGSANSKFMVDLGESVSGITGIRIKNYFGGYGITTADVSSSIDGVTWTNYGTANIATGSDTQYIKPYKTFNARYVRLDITGWQSIYIALTEFDLYK